MEEVLPHRLIQFGNFEVDLQARELRKSGAKVKLSGKPFQLLVILLDSPGQVVTREELHRRLWPDTFVDFEHSLNAAIRTLREALGDPAESPRFVETMPRRGYRFIAPVQALPLQATPELERGKKHAPRSLLLFSLAAIALAVGFGVYWWRSGSSHSASEHRALSRLTFDDGLQSGPTWSPDGRFLAYSSDRGGKFDIWVQQVSGGDPVQVTHSPDQNWQPDWSPDGRYIAYRSEDKGGGVFIVPALGGKGLERQITTFGYDPQWSPDGSQILFGSHFTGTDTTDRFYVVSLDGSAPRGVHASFTSESSSEGNKHAFSAAWHPDGKRISMLAGYQSPAPTLWTVPLNGGEAVKSEISRELLQQFKELAMSHGVIGFLDYRFRWSPSGDAIYFERSFRGATNVWRMQVDPQSLKVLALDRLTTGPGPDADFSVSRDGKRLAFTTETKYVRVWMFPFDATQGKVTGAGQPLTSVGFQAYRESLSRDGNSLAFCALRGGSWTLWEKSLPGGRETPILIDDPYIRDGPQWSPDGTRLAYERIDLATHQAQLAVWSKQDQREEAITTAAHVDFLPHDWTPAGDAILMAQLSETTGRNEIWRFPLSAAPHAETAAQKLIADPKLDVYQSHYSPDGRWIVFETVANAPQGEQSSLFVMPAQGGPWIRLTDGKIWADKPHWAADGKTIYFILDRSGFVTVQGIHFDGNSGRPVGDPFEVTGLEKLNLTIRNIPLAELSITQDRLVISREETAGSVWVLDDLDK